MIYIFDLLEFQVLAAAKGINEYYGLPMQMQPDREDICLAVYRLAREEILRQEGEELVIQNPVSAYMDGIANSPYTVVIERSRHALPRQCVYHDSRGLYICLESSSTGIEQVCLSAMKEGDFLQQMTDLSQLPEPRLAEDVGQYDFSAYWEARMPQELRLQLASGTDTEVWFQWDMVHTVFTRRDKQSGILSDWMIIIDFPLEYCMIQIRQESGNIHMERYDKNRAWEVLKTWWRG